MQFAGSTHLQACDAALLCRCWLYLADALGKVLAPLPEGFQQHIIWAFSTRAKQQDQVLCHLALFLDPRYRQAALSSSSNIMASFVQESAQFGYLQGWDQEKINQLLSQLSNYSRYLAPFNLPASGTGFSCQTWWSTVGQNADGAVLAEMAGVLLDVVPHAAGPERVFSQMGWYEGSTSTRMTTDTTAKKVSIKLHYDAVKPPQRKYVWVVRTDGCYWCLCISLYFKAKNECATATAEFECVPGWLNTYLYRSE